MWKTLAGWCALVIFGISAVACDPMQTRAITVTPAPASVGEDPLTVAAAVASRHGFREQAGTPFTNDPGWRCFFAGALRFCGKPTDAGVQFHLAEPSMSWSHRARVFWTEFQAELEAVFGAERVRECRWRRDPATVGAPEPTVRHICVPVAGRAELAADV